MAALVPGEMNGNCACANDEEAEAGCGSTNRRGGGGEMAAMEQKLAENEAVAFREVEVTLPAKQQAAVKEMVKSPSTHDKRKRGRKKVVRQVMGRCEKCGYLSSQSICKACMLLDGLNKARPATQIEVGVEEEESTTLMRHIAALEISAA